MKNIFISEEAYNEFKQMLDDANVESYNIRIGIDGQTCSGPIFNIIVSEADLQDEIETIKDINFIVEKSLLEQYGGFEIVSSDENNGDGVGLRPVVIPSSSCGGCGGGCGSGDSGCDGCH